MLSHEREEPSAVRVLVEDLMLLNLQAICLLGEIEAALEEMGAASAQDQGEVVSPRKEARRAASV